MKADFHYSVIKILAIKAGFNEKESQIIAHSSQYVDDATTYQPVRVLKTPSFILNHPRYYKELNLFDPICTAHKLLGFVNGLFDVSQKKVYVAFHFIPYQQLNDIDVIKDKHYVTGKAGKFATDLIKEALLELKNCDKNSRTDKLIKLGIILHSYSDTFSHQGFSGIHSPFNDITNLKYKENGKFVKKNYDYRPNIGHCEADDYPDNFCLTKQTI